MCITNAERKNVMNTIISDRIDVRISKQQKELVKYASDLSGFKSLSEFVVYCISKEANNIILENKEVLKTLEDKQVFVNALLHPPAPNAALEKAQQQYQNFLQANAVSNPADSKGA